MKIAHIVTILIAVSFSVPWRYAMSKEPVEIQVGEAGISMTRRLHPQVKIKAEPAGLNFYEIRWPATAPGRILVKFGDHKLPIENVLSVTGTEDLELKGEGVSEININSTITPYEFISHDEARLKFFSILQKIVLAGWQTTIPRDMARLRGKDMTNYLLRSKRYTTLDPSYVPSLTEWMEMPSLTSWEFHANQIYLVVQFTREHTLTDPRKPGAYLLSFELKSEPEYFRGYVAPQSRKRWMELLPAAITELSKSRANLEAELRLKGVSIDDRYIDPPIPNLLKR